MVIEKYMSAMIYFACTADTWGINQPLGMRMGRPQQIHTSLEWILLVAAAFAFALALAFAFAFALAFAFAFAFALQ